MVKVIEHRLYDQTWFASDYDLIPKLRRLSVPTLVLHGGNDFITIPCATHVSDAIPEARFILLEDCGHFSYLENPEKVYQEIESFLLAGQSINSRLK